MIALKKGVREHIKFLEKNGYKIRKVEHGGKHIKLFIKNMSMPVIISKTSSDRRSQKNSLAFLRRNGVCV